MTNRESDNEKVIIRSAPIQQGALIAIILFLIAQGTAWVWWASATGTTLTFMRDELVGLKGSVGNYVQVKADLASLEKEFITVRENGSPITDRRLTLLEYKIKEIADKKL